MKWNMILASDKNYGIGINGQLPWNIPEDLKYFSMITKQTRSSEKINLLVFGSNTAKTLPKFKLENRRLFLLTSTPDQFQEYKDRFTIGDINVLVQYIELNHEIINNIFICGGAKIYEYFLSIEEIKIDYIYWTMIYKEYNCDTYLSQDVIDIIKRGYLKISDLKNYSNNETGMEFSFLTFKKI
jgi:dihydrofolate reductase